MSCQVLVDTDNAMLLVGQLLNHMSLASCAAERLEDSNARKQHTA